MSIKQFFHKALGKERDMEMLIGKQLRYGVMLACGVTLLGGLMYLFQQKGTIPNYAPIPDNEPFAGTADYLRGLTTILSRALALDGAAIIQLGVCILIATPIIRIILSIFGFLIEKDYMYVIITLLVLLIIIANMILGIH